MRGALVPAGWIMISLYKGEHTCTPEEWSLQREQSSQCGRLGGVCGLQPRGEQAGNQQAGRRLTFEDTSPLCRLYFKVLDIKRPDAVLPFHAPVQGALHQVDDSEKNQWRALH